MTNVQPRSQARRRSCLTFRHARTVGRLMRLKIMVHPVCWPRFRTGTSGVSAISMARPSAMACATLDHVQQGRRPSKMSDLAPTHGVRELGRIQVKAAPQLKHRPATSSAGEISIAALQMMGFAMRDSVLRQRSRSRIILLVPILRSILALGPMLPLARRIPRERANWNAAGAMELS